MVLLITDGKQTLISIRGEPSPNMVADAMKARGIEILAMGIGAADPVELWMYASSIGLVLYSQDFSEVHTEVIQQSRLLCPRKS